MGDAPQERPFPPEIWELIFRHCSVPVLKRLRLVCHWWNAIVMGSPSLWRRFHVRFWQFNESLCPAMLPPVRRVTFQRDVEVASSWWPSFGPTLEDLSFDSVDVTMTALFDMLKHCPKLRRLYLSQVRLLDGQVDDDFSLDSMEELEIDDIYLNDIDLPYYLVPGISCLKKFSLYYVSDRFPEQAEFEIDCWIRFIHDVEDTLQILKLPSEFVLVEYLCEMKRLHLKHVDLSLDNSTHPLNMDLWITFCQMQQSLQELRMNGNNITNEVLVATVQNLPSLKKIESILTRFLSSPRQTVVTFLNAPNSVQRADIYGFPATLLFRSPLSPTLAELMLAGTRINDGIEYLLSSQHIIKLDLSRCDLSGCPVPKRNFSVLQQLVLSECNVSPEMLDYMLGNHPRLQKAGLYSMDSIDKGAVLKLLCASPKLRKIRMLRCFRFDAAAGAEVMQDYCKAHNVRDGSREVRFDFG